jgi:phosphodiesterase/alkaline phosphatase D-like protein
MGAMHTLSNGTLKMTAQMGPLGADDIRTGELQVQREGDWQTVATGEVRDLSYTMPFRVDDWDAATDTPYRIVYDLRIAGASADTTQTYTYEGTIRAEPQRNDFILASMNCQHFSARPDEDASARGFWNSSGIWFPHAEVASAVAYHNPDMLFFAGDQIYEGGLDGIVREPYDVAALDYLYHWYWFVWSFRDLMRDIPTIATPDDHDVYQGNIWGAGGKKAEPVGDITAQDSGGYTMDPRWVNAVHETQSSHLPDPPDPTPIEQGITVWYSSVDYGGLSFAVVSDRMFKSAPTVTVPDGRVVNGWFQNPRFDPATQSDVPEAVLLGRRQLDFLDDWGEDWSGAVWMKVLLSQTLFSNLATLPADAPSGAVLPGLDLPAPGEYVEGDRKAADADSDGWPQSGRNRALRAMRKAFAPHVAGDQHLGSVIQYGIDAFEDGPFAFVVPSVANLWPRRWYPPEPGANRAPGAPPYTGEHLDGFGNRMTVHAVANPMRSGVQPSALYDRVPGYGIIRFDKLSRDIVFEAWPRWVDPSQPGAEQYPGWPVEFNQLDNYGGEVGYLPTIEVSGLTDPVVQLIDERDGEVVYTVRIAGSSFRPKVFDAGTRYTVVVGEPDSGQEQRLEGLAVGAGDEVLQVAF